MIGRVMRFSLKNLLVFVTGSCLFLGLLVNFSPVSKRGQFYWSTGFVLPHRSRIVRYEETHGGFFNDGYTLVVVDIGAERARRWTEGRPPWSNHWQTGVPEEWSFDCDGGHDSGETLVQRKGMVYDISDHEGQRRNFGLLMVSPSQGLVYFLKYDS